jgi:hypothetical protein
MTESSRRSWRKAAAPAACVLALALLPPHAADAQQPPPGGVGMPQGEVALVARFDADGNGRLDAQERAAARAWLESQPPPARPAAPGAAGAAPQGPPGGPPGGGPPGGGPPGAAAGAAARPPAPGPQRILPGTPGAALTPADVRLYGDEGTYDPATLRTIFIDFDTLEWEPELAAFFNTDVDVPARAVIDGRTYSDVGVSFRGASSFRMVPEGSKRSLKLRLDFVHEEQHLGGFRTLNLLNSMNDPAFVRTALYSHIAREYLMAPRVNMVRVVINGENWGVYLNAQQFNNDMIRDQLGTAGGARWKVPGSPRGRGGMEYLGEDVERYSRLYEIKTRDDPRSWDALIRMFRILNETPLEQLEAELAPHLDIDNVLRFLALEIVLVNSDGYWSRGSDYHIHLGQDGRFRVVPHDMNEAFGYAGSAELDPLARIDDATKPLRSRLLAVPALRERYLGYVREMAGQWLDWNVLEPIALQYRNRIAEDVMRDTRKHSPNEAFDSSLEALRTFVEGRREFLLRQN